MGSVGSGDKYTVTLRNVETKIYDDEVETAVVLDSNGDVVVDKSEGLKGAVHFTKDELAKMDGKTLTHNHPSSSTFSMEDVNLFLNTNLQEIRAVGADGTIFSLQRTPDTDPNFINAYYSNDRIYCDWELDPIYNDAKRRNEQGILSDDEYNKIMDSLNSRQNAERRRWLKENASLYGVKYTESKRR